MVAPPLGDEEEEEEADDEDDVDDTSLLNIFVCPVRSVTLLLDVVVNDVDRLAEGTGFVCLLSVSANAPTQCV